ncbi:MAG TPA: hypothetical protein VHW93_11325 [Acidimicrobiales bacterium]|nr:hypothetical protein [Acidimicrobiales bacterium]
MALVIIIVMAWLVILGPSLVKRRSRTAGGVNSISHFHRQLRILESSAPEPIVTPAFRLRSVNGSATGPGSDRPGGAGALAVAVAPKLSVVGADLLPRPALAFLGQDPAGVTAGADAGAGDGIDEVWNGVRSGHATVPSRPPTRPPKDARAVVRRRRRDTLAVLVGMVSTTFLLGFLPAARPAWIVTLMSALVLAAYVAMLVRMRKLAEERERKLHHLRPRPALPYDVDLDAEQALPVGVTGLPVRVSGRYAHPSNQAAAAH